MFRLLRDFPRKLRLFLDLYLAGFILVVSHSALTLPLTFSEDLVYSSLVGLGMLAIIIGLVVVASRTLGHLRDWLVIISLSVVSTALSGFYLVSRPPILPCDFATIRSGFPLPWHYGYRLQADPSHPCILPLFFPPDRFAWGSFLLDIFFYAAASFVLVELSKFVLHLINKHGFRRLIEKNDHVISP